MQSIRDTIDTKAYMDRFKGFCRPNTTPTPDELFDVFLTELTHAELKILLYIIRRTFGFKKDVDSISLNQISNGIVTKAGKQLDRGAGVDRRTAMRVVKQLENKGLITVVRRRTADGFNKVNNYQLRFRG